LGPAGTVRVVADSHALVWYVCGDQAGRLSPTALAALAAAEADEGIAVSSASLVDLWYVTQTTRGVSAEQLAAIMDLLRDPNSTLDQVPIDIEIITAFAGIPLSSLRDPWDRLITATAMALSLPLVTADSRITATRTVEIIW